MSQLARFQSRCRRLARKLVEVVFEADRAGMSDADADASRSFSVASGDAPLPLGGAAWAVRDDRENVFCVAGKGPFG
jgi:hypothetical protein